MSPDRQRSVKEYMIPILHNPIRAGFRRMDWDVSRDAQKLDTIPATISEVAIAGHGSDKSRHGKRSGS